MMKDLKRVYEHRYFAFGFCVIAAALTALNGFDAFRDGRAAVACFSFFASGVNVGVALFLFVVAQPRFNARQRAEVEAELRKIFNDVFADAKRRGLVPPDAEVENFTLQ